MVLLVLRDPLDHWGLKILSHLQALVDHWVQIDPDFLEVLEVPELPEVLEIQLHQEIQDFQQVLLVQESR